MAQVTPVLTEAQQLVLLQYELLVVEEEAEHCIDELAWVPNRQVFVGEALMVLAVKASLVSCTTCKNYIQVRPLIAGCTVYCSSIG